MSKKKRDYYEVLGLDKNASADDIKRAFRKLAKEYHPDVSTATNAEEKFKEVNEAYQVLSNSERKANYDQFGHQGVNFGQQGGFDGFGFNFSDIFSGFSDFFGGGFENYSEHTEQQSSRNKNWKFNLELTFFEAMHGIKKKVKIDLEEICSDCQGTGAQSLSDLTNCNVCQGKGEEIIRKNTIFGIIQQKKICSKCQGVGQTIQNKCKFCQGKKINRKKTELEVVVPKGVDDGQQMKFPGKGGINSLTQEQGDLYFQFHVQTSPIFKREENDLFTDIPVSYLDALLGKEIEIPTIDGIKLIDLESNTKNNKIIRLKNYGAYNPNNPNKRGHHYLRIKIQFPNKLTKEEKTFLSEMETKTNFQPNKEFIENLKKKGWIFTKKQN